jgi:hypothetical protein
MKKLLSTFLVIGLVSVVNAAPLDSALKVEGSVGGSLEDGSMVVVGEVVTVTIGNVGNPSAGGPSNLMMTATPATGGSVGTHGTWLLDPSPAPSVETSDSGLLFKWLGGTIGLNVEGEWLWGSFTVPDGFGQVDVSFSGTLFGQTPGGFTLTPEPATIALLALGGLFLRRRK